MNDRLRKARRAKGLTQDEMAKLLGYQSKSGYSMIETGRNRPPLPVALHIAKIVGQEVEQLFPASDVHTS
ncbi:helix-turn-helix transcriptional regulator [Paenibacillus hemerocallicola]|uniref:Helix-turn-helix transcriptional regulator n=1 Tax=Paenibacillus hemerocallicola TaxID=1172614 RepID=A0A5C4T4M9_9BACL|nr:helix-turn-helix transcriptional regulator [Paenibacillus hemerocallicola]TNJ64031.1 helix-turn-helix transcriptional regulator [Paenibacillus hemerocallicola]